MFWGSLSDRFGRRPILLLGLLGNLSTIILFGFSETFVWTIAARAANGLLNGNIGVAKSYLLEVSDDTNSAKAFGVLGVTWGVGVMIGPVIGGYLSNPVDKHPHIFPAA
jgi:MFS family permease